MKRNEIYKIGLATGLAIVTTSLLSSCAILVGKSARELSKTEPGREILFKSFWVLGISMGISLVGGILAAVILGVEI